jgi:hypothetical protein
VWSEELLELIIGNFFGGADDAPFPNNNEGVKFYEKDVFGSCVVYCFSYRYRECAAKRLDVSLLGWLQTTLFLDWERQQRE